MNVVYEKQKTGGYTLSLAGSNRAIFINEKYFRNLLPDADHRTTLGCGELNTTKAQELFGEIEAKTRAWQEDYVKAKIRNRWAYLGL